MPPWLETSLIVAAVGLALFIRLRRMATQQRLRLGAMWIVPLLFLIFAGVVFAQFPPQGLGWLWVAIGFLCGCAIGWQRGRLVEIRHDADTGRLYQRSSPGAFLFLAALFGVRWVFHEILAISDARWHLGAMLVTDIVIAFAVGILSLYRVEIYLRARRILAAR